MAEQLSVCVNENKVSFVATGVANDLVPHWEPEQREPDWRVQPWEPDWRDRPGWRGYCPGLPAFTVVDTKEASDWASDTVTWAELLRAHFDGPVHYTINLRLAPSQSYFAFSPTVTPGQVVSMWYLRSDTTEAKEAKEAEEIITKVRLYVNVEKATVAKATVNRESEMQLIAKDLDTFMTDTEANEVGKERIRKLQDHAYKWAAHVAMTNLEAGLCSHESKQPPTLEADLKRTEFPMLVWSRWGQNDPSPMVKWEKHMSLANVIKDCCRKCSAHLKARRAAEHAQLSSK